MQSNKIYSLLYVLTLTILVGCGGGSGGSSNQDVSFSAIKISASNAKAAACSAYNGTASLEGAGTGTAGSLTGALVQTSSERIDPVSSIINQMKKINQLNIAAASNSLIGAVVTVDAACDISGSVSITIDDADNNQDISTGDTLSIRASNCLDDTTTLNGSFSISNLVLSGDIEAFPYSFEMTLNASDFTVTEAGEAISMNGDMTINETTTDGINISDSIIGNRVTITGNGQTYLLTNFNIQATENLNTEAYTLSVNGTVGSSDINGEVTIVTDTLFQGIGDNDPFVGQATITGDENTKVVLITVGSTLVNLEIDADGDDVFESIDSTTWCTDT